jgi:DNA-binding MarR family transcriptional regulator
MARSGRRTEAPTASRAPTPSAAVSRDDLGFLLAKATQRWNELLHERLTATGFGEVRPSYGSILVPLFEEDGLRLSELARRARLSKQTMTTMVRLLERDGLVVRRPDPTDGRASLVSLTPRGRLLEPVAASILAELDGLARQRLGATDALKDALRALMELEAD